MDKIIKDECVSGIADEIDSLAKSVTTIIIK